MSAIRNSFYQLPCNADIPGDVRVTDTPDSTKLANQGWAASPAAVNAVSNIYTATFLLDGWENSTDEDKKQGYIYTQTVAISPAEETPNAPPITKNSVFLSPVFRTPLKISEVDDILDKVLPIINDGITSSGDGVITTIVKEKPSADVVCKWDMKA